MTIATSDVVEVTQAVCASLLGDETPVILIEGREDGRPARDIVAGVTIEGAWRGAVEVHVSEGLAKRLARDVLMIDDAPADSADVADLVGEVANMIGGNLKGLLPDECRLSIPSAGPVGQRDARTAIDRRFIVGDDGLVVIVKHFRELNGEAA